MKTRLAIVQEILETTPDSLWGPSSQEALDGLIAWCTPHVVKASSFADLEDIEAFHRCKAQGKSDEECFRVGDNGIGKWGDDTTQDMPMCALPPEDWNWMNKPRGALVRVELAGGKAVFCELRDTMPHKANIHNGAGIDLNPAACAALGLKPPMLVKVTWIGF